MFDEKYLVKIFGVKFIWDSLHALDSKTHVHGFTPFHLAIEKGNPGLLRYLVKMYRCRDYNRLIF
jgi:hypothetical protein